MLKATTKYTPRCHAYFWNKISDSGKIIHKAACNFTIKSSLVVDWLCKHAQSSVALAFMGKIAP